MEGNMKRWLPSTPDPGPHVMHIQGTISAQGMWVTSPGILQHLSCITATYGNPDHPKFMISSSSVWCHALSIQGFPGSSVGKESACNEGDPVFIPGWGRASREGNGNPLQYSCLKNPMDRAAWQAMGSQSMGSQRVGHDLKTKPPQNSGNK